MTKCFITYNNEKKVVAARFLFVLIDKRTEKSAIQFFFGFVKHCHHKL